MRAFGSGTKYRRCLSKCGNKGKNGYKGTGTIGKILGKILYNSELITHPFKQSQLRSDEVLTMFAQNLCRCACCESAKAAVSRMNADITANVMRVSKDGSFVNGADNSIAMKFVHGNW